MKVPEIKFSAKLQLYPGDAAWHYFVVPAPESESMKELYIWPRKGFGSIPVLVTIGKTSWKTSVFPQKEGTFFLPIKKQVRVAESIVVGQSCRVTIEILN